MTFQSENFVVRISPVQVIFLFEQSSSDCDSHPELLSNRSLINTDSKRPFTIHEIWFGRFDVISALTRRDSNMRATKACPFGQSVPYQVSHVVLPKGVRTFYLRMIDYQTKFTNFIHRSVRFAIEFPRQYFHTNQPARTS